MICPTSAALQAANPACVPSHNLSRCAAQLRPDSSRCLRIGLDSLPNSRQIHDRNVGVQTRTQCRASASQNTGSSQLWLPEGSLAAGRSSGLDPGMMLLRQRIIFLGSQVDLTSSSHLCSTINSNPFEASHEAAARTRLTRQSAWST